MTQVFADTLYWVASITPGDPWYAPTLLAVVASWTCGSCPDRGGAGVIPLGLRWARRIFASRSAQDRPSHPGQRPCNRDATDTQVIYEGIGFSRQPY